MMAIGDEERMAPASAGLELVAPNREVRRAANRRLTPGPLLWAVAYVPGECHGGGGGE